METVSEQDTSFGGYRVERMLGRGGMGVVYEAVQTSLDRRVALKVLRSDLAEDPAFVTRFQREGRLQASIEHPHVLDVYEVGESPAQGLFLAMRLVRGPTLADLLRGGELGVARSLDLLEQAGDALDAAHAAGLLHRDVKPRNILVGEGDHAFLADFGLSRAGADAATSSRPMAGTVAYVAPEVIRGEAPVAASDRYAFAATLFHCLTGDVVFPRGSDAAVLYAHASEPPPRISERRPGLPAALDPVFDAALAKDPAMRPAGSRELVEQVRAAIGEEIAALGPPGPGGGEPGGPGRPEAEPAGGSPSRRSRIAVLAGVALAAGALGAGVVALLDDDDGDGAEAAIPVVAEGAQPLGSALGEPAESLDCRGAPPGRGTTSCSVVQTELPDAQLLAPADGTIVGWSVRGASGDIALDVIRARGEDTVRVGRTQWEFAGNREPFHFPANLPVERGDLIGVELGPGAGIGVAATEGAATQRWLNPKGGAFGSPDRDAGTGFDHELLLRADFVPGVEPKIPEAITGASAADAPDGSVRKRIEVEISKPPSTVDVELVEVGDRVAVDLLRGNRRVSRVYMPGLLPGGEPIELKAFTYEGEDFSEIDVWWVNPNTGRVIFHFLNASPRELQFVG